MMLMLEQFWPVVAAAMSPFLELRGSIPLGILALHLDPLATVIVSVVSNALVFFPVYVCLGLLYHRLFERFGWARRTIEHMRSRGGPVIERYGILGLMVFVAIPLPMTGAWTGTGIAWLLGLEWKRSFLAIALGVLIAAAIVSPLVLLFGMVI